MANSKAEEEHAETCIVLWHWSWRQLSPRHRASRNLARPAWCTCGRKMHEQCAGMALPSKCPPPPPGRRGASSSHVAILKTHENPHLFDGVSLRLCHCRCCRHAAHKRVAIEKALHHSGMWKVVVDCPKAVLHSLHMSGDGKSSILSSLTNYKLLQHQVTRL